MLFTPEDEKEIIKAINNAESLSTGEIRVHLDQHLKGDPLATAQSIFYKIGMQKTKDRNGVLFYVSENLRKIAIIGDENIHKYVRQSFWNEILGSIIEYFKKEEYKEGLIDAIGKTGIKLKKYFPANGRNNPNELSNEISR